MIRNTKEQGLAFALLEWVTKGFSDVLSFAGNSAYAVNNFNAGKSLTAGDDAVIGRNVLAVGRVDAVDGAISHGGSVALPRSYYKGAAHEWTFGMTGTSLFIGSLTEGRWLFGAYHYGNTSASGLPVGAWASNSGVVDLGRQVNPWNNCYLSNSPVIVSDEREKEWRGGLSKAEMVAANAMLKEIGLYSWIKRDDKALVCGVRAQQVIKCLESAKLKNEDYGFVKHAKWDAEVSAKTVKREVAKEFSEDEKVLIAKKECDCDEEETLKRESLLKPSYEMVDTEEMETTIEAGDRYMINADAVIFFMVAAMNQRIESIEAARQSK